MRSSSIAPPRRVSEEEPTLRTTRRAAAMSGRAALPSGGTAAPPGRATAPSRWTAASLIGSPLPASRNQLPALEAGVRAARAWSVPCPGLQGGVPVEDDRVVLLADENLIPRRGTRLREGVLDAEPGQPDSQVADRCLVREVRLPFPALGLLTHDEVRTLIEA